MSAATIPTCQQMACRRCCRAATLPLPGCSAVDHDCRTDPAGCVTAPGTVPDRSCPRCGSGDTFIRRQ